MHESPFKNTGRAGFLLDFRAANGILRVGLCGYCQARGDAKMANQWGILVKGNVTNRWFARGASKMIIVKLY